MFVSLAIVIHVTATLISAADFSVEHEEKTTIDFTDFSLSGLDVSSSSTVT